MHDTNLLEDQPVAWTPTPETIERSQLNRFMKQVGVSTWDELYDFSIRDVERFTEEVLKFLDIKFDPPYEKLLDVSNGIEMPAWLGRNADALVRNGAERNADALVRNEDERNADALVRNGAERNADALVRNGAERNADALVRNEDEVRTPANALENKKGWHERGYLPHFDGAVTQFVTFRLADSMPQDVLRRFEAEIEAGKFSDPSKEYRRKVEDYLDSGIGECILKNPEIAEIVKETLLNEQEKSCRLFAWVVMPNHVHIQLRPLEGSSLSDIMQRVKSVTSHKINKLLERSGPVWQPDYFDRYIRDFDHFEKTYRYIENNPVKAGLCTSPEQWKFSSASHDKPSVAGTRTPPSAMSAEHEQILSPEEPAIAGTRTPPSAVSAKHEQILSPEEPAIAGTRTPPSAMSAEHEQIRSPEEPTIADEGVRVPSAGLNITTMCLDRWLGNEWNDQPAIIWEGEDGATQVLSYSFLADNVEILVGTLRVLGIGKGDAVGIHLPMIPETILALLAINRVGAIAVPVFSGYGVEAIASRMQAVQAKALITCEGFHRRGKFIDMLRIAADAVRRTDSITKVLVTGIAVSDEEHFDQIEDTKGPLRFVHQQEHLEKIFPNVIVRQFGVTHNMIDLLGADEKGPEPTAAEDPLIVLYTSGTTGKPKGIAHTHASFPIKAAQDMAFGTDVGKGTRICWYTDIGWMMGPWLIYGALINGATICLYDGAPDYPTNDRMWEFCAKHKVEVLGISPTLIRSLAAVEERNADAPVRNEAEGRTDVMPQAASADEGIRVPPFERHDLSSLRIFASTGEPWNPAPWWWLFEKVGNSKLPIINYSGGTEIAGGILMGNPLLPIKPCSFPAPCPGMHVDILDDEGNPVPNGTVGELVIKQPWIGMARGFWQEKERYLETYWRRFKDIWVHGDWAMRDQDGHWFILGRSDDTLKVAGKRVGPAEVESLLVAHPLVTEAAVIGVPDPLKGTAMVAFVVTGKMSQVKSAEEIADPSLVTHQSSLETELKALVSRDMGKPLTPSKIHFVSALPKTRNAKVMRRVIRSAYLGEDPGDLSSLEDPGTITEISAVGRGKA